MLKRTSLLAASFCAVGLLTQCSSRSGGSTSASAPATTDPNSAPVITVQPQSQTVTAPAPATFLVKASGIPAPSYKWSVNGALIAGATGAAYTIPATAAAQDGFSYTVEVDNGVGAAVVSSPAVLTVHAAPVITAQPAGVAVAPGGVATFTVKATGNPAIKYQWRLAGNDLPGATAATYSTAPVSAANDSESYTVAVSNGIGAEVVSNPAILIVGQAPAITTQPGPVTVLAPTAATFTVIATGHPLAYQWQDETGANIPGATSAALTIPDTSAAFNGRTYRVVVSGFGAPVTSAPALLTVNAAAAITTQPLGQILAVGDRLDLTVRASGVPATFIYQWYRNGAAIPGATNATYSVAAAALADNGNYYVDVSNGPGTAQSAIVPVTVTQLHTVSGNVALVSGGPAAGVILSINTNPAGSTTADANGHYTLPAVPAGNWTITPSAPGLSSVFFPASAAVHVSANLASDFQANRGYTVAGRLTYRGTRSGPVYLTLVDANGGQTMGTSAVTGEVNYSIRGVPPGTYTLNAAMDISGGTLRTVNDPSGTRAAVTVVGADLDGQALTLADPTPASLKWQAGPATLTGPAGTTCTVSGSVTFTGAATGPLYVGLLDRSTRTTADQAYIAMVQNPVNGEGFAVSGVPQAANGYTLLGFIDQNDSGRNEAGDLSVAPLTNLSVDGNMVVPDLDMFRDDSQAVLGTSHVQTNGGNDQYRLLLRVRDQNRHVISATLTAGPNVMVPMDLASPNMGPLLGATLNLAGNVPQVDDVYTVQVNYSDGTSDFQNPQVTGVLNRFVQTTAPTDVNMDFGSGNNVTPQFSWADPVTATEPHDYRFSIQTMGGPVLRRSPLTNNLYYKLPLASALSVGTPYLWTVTYRETATDNETETISTYTP